MAAILEPSNAGRNWLVHVFLKQVVPRVQETNQLRVGVVGGTKLEPEILELAKLVPRLEISTLGIEKPDYYLDLNDGADNFPGLNFDLLLCSQVLEHVWNHGKFFGSLYNLLAPQGILWINVPASNRAHGSPEFYSAGFTRGYLEKNLMQTGFKIVGSGSIGTKRNYIATHLLPYWLSVYAHRFPLFCIRYNTGKVKNTLLFLRYFFILVRLQITSSRIRNEGRYLTESWVIATRSS